MSSDEEMMLALGYQRQNMLANRMNSNKHHSCKPNNMHISRLIYKENAPIQNGGGYRMGSCTFSIKNLFRFFEIVFPLLLVLIVGLTPKVCGYTFAVHQTCKGWTQEGQPITADRFSLTDEKVYLYFNISWPSVQEYEQKWGQIPTFQKGLISAGRIEESFQMATLRISLMDPSQTVVNSFGTRIMHKVACKPPGCISSAFLEILTITNQTKNGRWKLNWYDGNQLIFTNEFVVGEEEIAPEQTFLEKYGLLIGAILVVIAVVAVAAYIFIRKKKAPEVPKPAAQSV